MGVTDEPPSRRPDRDAWLLGDAEQRFTQDSPVLPQVWLAYAREPDQPQDLLLTPDARSSAAELASWLHEREPAAQAAGEDTSATALAYNDGYVVATVSFRTLVHDIVPFAGWWGRNAWTEPGRRGDEVRTAIEEMSDLGAGLREAARFGFEIELPRELKWYVEVVGRIAAGEDADAAERRAAAAELLAGVDPRPSAQPPPLLYRVTLNRVARTTVHRSREAIKADAATRLFDTSCATVRWAVIDDGIDATHPAFRRRDRIGGAADSEPFAGAEPLRGTRVQRTYDFTRLRPLLAGQLPGGQLHAASAEAQETAFQEMRDRLRIGRSVDWDAIAPALRVDDPGDAYTPPQRSHGTHVAGILAGDWPADDPDNPSDVACTGICPDIELYDIRVFDEHGAGDEFTIMAALQFVRHLNAHSDLQVIHGVNLSLAIDHDVRNYACGRTPVCDECERLVAAGVVVVAAAGNEGRASFTAETGGQVDGYRTTSITDPGNADGVITVGSTHRTQAHTYGVSYFSSRGPTGDGRAKPDLVAPGEKIEAPGPGADLLVKDGTSMAAPHVSGAAALLMARHEELRAQPQRIKRLLCETATDLGRERYFQGAGMLDVLRALQAV